MIGGNSRKKLVKAKKKENDEECGENGLKDEEER
jgi:hypothetical protein